MAGANLGFLEDQKRYPKVDPDDFYKLLVDFPSQLRQAVEIAGTFHWTKNHFRPLNIVVAGLGGSAMGGDLVRSLLGHDLTVPFQIVRHYTLPAFVGPQTLFVASSYSGNTEETLSAFEIAAKLKAEIICLTSGGKLAQRAGDYPVLAIPPGYPPRAALGFSFVLLLLILGKIGLAPDYSQAVLRLTGFLKKEITNWEKEVARGKNEAKKLAAALYGRIPLIYAGSDFLEAVAVRWKGQVCENAKQLAFHNFFPEFNHNELVGFGVLKHLTGKLSAVFLQDEDDHPRVSLRMQIVEDVLKKKKIPVHRVVSKGEMVLERVFYSVLFGDFVSYYLAILNGVDPKPVEVIDYFKGRLEKS